MPVPPRRFPKYRDQKSRNLAVVRIDGRQIIDSVYPTISGILDGMGS